MPSNNFNIGRDCSVVIVHPFLAASAQIKHITDFDPKQGIVMAAVDRLDGEYLSAALPKNWTGTIGIDRGNAVLDTFVAALETAYYSGVNVPAGQVYQYITEVDGSTTTYQFQKCAFHLPNAGSWKNDAVIKMQLGFTASRRVKV